MTSRSLAWIALCTTLAACGPVIVGTSSMAPADSACSGGWVDPGTGLCWQPEARDTPLVWSAAHEYCYDLSLGGHQDWRLPTVDEMRTLVRQCPLTERGGACKVHDGSGRSDWSVGDCLGCPDHQGIGEGGAYWDPALVGPTSRGYWTASEVANRLDESWIITSTDAFVAWEAQASGDHHVRCVRERAR